MMRFFVLEQKLHRFGELTIYLLVLQFHLLLEIFLLHLSLTDSYIMFFDFICLLTPSRKRNLHSEETDNVRARFVKQIGHSCICT